MSSTRLSSMLCTVQPTLTGWSRDKMEKISSSLLKYFLQLIQTFAMIESNAKVCVSVPTKIKRKMIAI